mmetsp:Transcript_40392/g.67502  ORF Transcript_40392/g.67502 Transcript_40392/m.67502 type:complete len:459 (-) Transcript_40392:216-1592(-)
MEEDNDEEEEAPQVSLSADMPLEESLKNAPVSSVAKIRASKRFKTHLETVTKLLVQPRTEALVGPIEEDDEYRLIIESNAIVVEIDTEISAIHKYIRDRYAAKFPELESLVLNPLDYGRIVKQIGNEMDMTLVDLQGLLPSATIMVVSVTGSTTNGKPLPDNILANVLEACDEILALDASRKQIIEYVESRMNFIAPNLSMIVGTTIAAKMIAAAGGLTALSKMPACNVQVLGKKSKSLAGFSTANANPHAGFIYYCEIVQNCPPSYRKQAQRLISTKSTLAARVDSQHQDQLGTTGKKFREMIERRIEKLQEPPPPKQPKPLTAPDDKPRKKRAGKRIRKMKERYGITEVRKQQNRMLFGVAEDQYEASGKGFGMLGQSGSGKLRVRPADQKALLKVTKKQKTFGSSGTTSGLSSSLAFTPVQGLELGNPSANPSHRGDPSSKYFGTASTFYQVGRR